MEGERIIDKLRKGEKVLCEICKNDYMDVSSPNRENSNYFHCKNPNCTGYVHEQKNIMIE